MAYAELRGSWCRSCSFLHCGRRTPRTTYTVRLLFRHGQRRRDNGVGGADRRRLGEQVFDAAVHLLLLVKPLAAAGQVGGELVDAVGNGLGIGGDGGLFADEFNLLGDGAYLGFQERQLVPGLVLFDLALLQDIKLPGELLRRSSEMVVSLTWSCNRAMRSSKRMLAFGGRGIGEGVVDGGRREEKPEIYPCKAGPRPWPWAWRSIAGDVDP